MNDCTQGSEVCIVSVLVWIRFGEATLACSAFGADEIG